jgi:hypothetical protein
LTWYCTEDQAEKGWNIADPRPIPSIEISKLDSNNTQQSAFKNNSQLLKPREGINYKKLSYISENRIKRIRDWISSHENYQELSMDVNEILWKF